MDHALTELLRHMVSIPSVNPDGDPGTEKTGEAALAEFVAGFFEPFAKVRVEEVLPGRPNVFVRFPSATAGKPKILFAPHLDTVSVKGMTIPPFEGRVRDGRLWGRGACDTKGSMAAMMRALFEERDQLADLTHEIHFAAFMAEETGQYGSKAFASQRSDYAFAIIGEPTGCRVVHTHKGCVWFQLETIGVAAHASRPDLGRNAIVEMAGLLRELEAGFSEFLEQRGRNADLGAPTWNAGMIEGGSRANIVAERCRLTIDIRTTPELEQSGGAVKALTDYLVERTGAAPVTHLIYESKPLPSSRSEPLAHTLAQVGEGFDTAPWFCDAAIMAAAGVPSVAAGPGDIAQAHTADEWIDLDELEKGFTMYREFLRGLRGA